MNLSFTTRGWNSLSWEQQVNDAADMSFQGIEPYNIQAYPSLSGRGGAFHAYKMNETMRDIRKKGLELPCFDTSIDLSLTLPPETMEQIEYLFATASFFKTPYIAFSVLHDDDRQIDENLAALLPKAEEANLCVLLKTTGIYANTKRLRENGQLCL